MAYSNDHRIGSGRALIPRGKDSLEVVPLPDPGQFDASELLFEAVRTEIRNGVHPYDIYLKLVWRNASTFPAWEEQALKNWVQKYLLNSGHVGDESDGAELWNEWRELHPPKPELTGTERLGEAESARLWKQQRDEGMALLGVKKSRMTEIMTRGTAIPEQRRILAAGIAGTTEADWELKDAATPGRKPPPIAPTILALNLAGCSMHDFVHALPLGVGLEFVSETVSWLKREYRSDWPPARHFESFGQFKATINADIDDSDRDDCWHAYKAWRWDKIADAGEASLLDFNS